MKSRPKQPPSADPFKVFKHASAFVEADDFIRNKARLAGPERNMNAPMMILEAFAIELLLKCLLILEEKRPRASHNLDVLFHQLNDKNQRRIIELWEENARSKLSSAEKQLRLPTDLPNALAKCGSAFERLRYAYVKGAKHRAIGAAASRR